VLKVAVSAFEDDGTYNRATYDTLGSTSFIEIHIKRATTSSSSDGTVKMFLDGVEGSGLTGQDIDSVFDYDDLRVGAEQGVNSGTTGTLLFDEVVARNDSTTIGPLASDEAITEEEIVTVGESVTMQLGHLFVSVSQAVTVGESAMASSGSGNNMKTLLITGIQADINATVASLLYTSDSGFTGADTLTVRSENATSNVDIDVAALQIISSPPVPKADVITLTDAPAHRRRVN